MDKLSEEWTLDCFKECIKFWEGKNDCDETDIEKVKLTLGNIPHTILSIKDVSIKLDLEPKYPALVRNILNTPLLLLSEDQVEEVCLLFQQNTLRNRNIFINFNLHALLVYCLKLNGISHKIPYTISINPKFGKLEHVLLSAPMCIYCNKSFDEKDKHYYNEPRVAARNGHYDCMLKSLKKEYPHLIDFPLPVYLNLLLSASIEGGNIECIRYCIDCLIRDVSTIVNKNYLLFLATKSPNLIIWKYLFKSKLDQDLDEDITDILIQSSKYEENTDLINFLVQYKNVRFNRYIATKNFLYQPDEFK